MSDDVLLEVDALTVEYRIRGRQVRAVSDASFQIAAGETLGLVGESGSGKTTIGRAILGLVPVTSGRIVFRGRDITHDSRKQRQQHSDGMRAVFQDPFSSLNPALPISASLLEGVGRFAGRSQAEDRMRDLLRRVGFSPQMSASYPSTLSGGQRQRIAIARALMSSPEVVICDEPTSALDISVQAQVLNLLRELQAESVLGYLFISHDLDVVRYMSDRIIVLRGGEIIEEGSARSVTEAPTHPYTKALLAAAPSVEAAIRSQSSTPRHDPTARR